MLTLTYGFKKPQNGDKGSVFWDALALNCQLVNDHTHDGTNSAKLTAFATTAYTQPLAGPWVLVANGVYRQLVTVASGHLVDDYNISFRDTTSGYAYLLSYEKVSSTTFYVYINDNSVSVTAVYS